MNITEKLLEARKRIKETAIKKEGTNTFSKYDYFTPSQVSELVNTVCQELKILPTFSLRKDEFGLFGQLLIRDLEKDIFIETQMRTEMPKITATNMTQQMGGCETYTKRYMLMSAFDITDNNLDFDSQDNRPKETHTPSSDNLDMPPEPPKSDSKAQTEEKGMDIPLAVRNSKNEVELEVLWGTLDKAQKISYSDIIKIRKKELTPKN